MFWLHLCTKSKPKKLKSAFIHEEAQTPPTGGPAGAAVQITGDEGSSFGPGSTGSAGVSSLKMPACVLQMEKSPY